MGNENEVEFVVIHNLNHKNPLKDIENPSVVRKKRKEKRLTYKSELVIK